MQFEMCALPGGGKLELYLRSPDPAMPNALRCPLVLVVPGGGYEHVSAREADPVALQFAAAGYHTAVLTYSVGEGARNHEPLRQLRAAIGLLRQNAERWGILPDRIAVCGFSAGGHLALSGAVLDCPGEAADRSRKPDAVLLAYPVITAGEYAHRGSFVQLSGSEDRAEHQRFGLEGKITPDTRWRTPPSRWKTPCSSLQRCGRTMSPVRRICSRRGSTAPASPPQRWMPPAPTAPIGCSWRWNG